MVLQWHLHTLKVGWRNVCSFSGVNNGCSDCVSIIALDLKVSFIWSTCLLEILAFALVTRIWLLKSKQGPWSMFFCVKIFFWSWEYCLPYSLVSVLLHFTGVKREGGDILHLLAHPVINEMQKWSLLSGSKF